MEHQFLHPHCPEHSSVSTQQCRFIHLGFLITIRYLLTQECYREFQFSSVAQSYPTLCNPMNCSTPGLPVHHQLLEFTQTHVHRVGDAIHSHLILCRPLFILPPIPPSIRVFSKESTLRMRWPKYWSFSLSIGLLMFKTPTA